MKTPHFPWIVAWLIVLAGSLLSNVDGAWWNPGTKDAGSVSLWGRPTTTSTPMLNGQPVVTYAANPASGSAFGKIASGTKQLVGGAVDIVTLKPVRTRLFSKKPTQTPVWQSQPQAWNPQQQEKKPGFFSSIFKSKEPEKKPSTVNEFLAQPKPE